MKSRTVFEFIGYYLLLPSVFLCRYWTVNIVYIFYTITICTLYLLTCSVW